MVTKITQQKKRRIARDYERLDRQGFQALLQLKT